MIDQEKEKRMIGTILLVIIAVSVVFIMFIGYYGIKINRGDYCATERIDYTNYDNINNSFILNTTSKYILQKYILNEPDYIDLSVCYNVETENTGGAEIQVIDGETNILATQFINNETSFYCTTIDSSELKQESYLGLRCSNCNSTKQVKLKYDTSGTNTEQVRYITSKEVSLEDPLSIMVLYKKSCKSVLKWLFEWYLFLISALGMLILLLLGYNKFAEILFKDI